MAQNMNRFLIPPPAEVDLSVLPDRLRNKLLPFQKQGINFAVSKNGRCLIGDEMGLGKTLQAIAIAYYYKAEWPLLILLPASIKYQWVEELEKWLPELLPTDINMINNSSDVGNITKCKINILAYSLIRYGNPNTSVLLKAIKAQKFKVVICDESHNIRNKNTRTANVVVDLIRTAVRCVLLSGTPALNKPSELYTQIDSILPGGFGTFNEYTIRYCDARYIYYGRTKVWNIDGAKNLDELELKLKQHLMIRRLKKNVLSQLPPKRRQKVPFDLKFDSSTAEIQQELTAMQEELERLLRSTGTTIAQVIQPSQRNNTQPALYDIRKLISQLYVKTCEAKVGPVVEFIMFYTNGNDDSAKVLVFAHHHAMMNSIQQAMWDASIKHIRIDGSVPSNDRHLLVKQFQSDPKTRVAILSILAAGSGLTLTAASIVVFAELYWTPAILMQCEDRAHRIGQTAQSVNIYYLVARGTIDERVWSMVEKKTRVLAMALDGQKKGLSAINSNKHVCDILSSAALQVPTEGDDSVQIDVDVEDFFSLAELKRQNQPTLFNFITPDRQLRSASKKRQKKLVIGRPEVVEIMGDDDDDAGVKTVKRPKMSNQKFMEWALEGKKADRPHSPGSDRSLPSLNSSPMAYLSDSDSGEPCDKIPSSASKSQHTSAADDATTNDTTANDTTTSDTTANDTTANDTTANVTTTNDTTINDTIANDTTTNDATANDASEVLTAATEAPNSLTELPSAGVEATESHSFKAETTSSTTELDAAADAVSFTTESPSPGGCERSVVTLPKQHLGPLETSTTASTSDSALDNTGNLDSEYTKIEDRKAYSPVDLQKSALRDVDTDNLELQEANFNIIPGKVGENGSDLSGDLFSDASFEDEIMNEMESSCHGTKDQVGMTQADKEEEARLAAELMANDDDDEEDDDNNGEYWKCQCGSINDRDLECCQKCALPQLPKKWTCKNCQTVNRLADDSCDECLTERDSGKDEHGEEERVVDLSAIPTHEKLYFLLSQHTDRIFIHNKDKEYLEASFHSVDLDNPDLLPDILLKPENFELAKKFVTKWNSLKKREQKSLVKKGELIDCPEKAYFGGRLTKLRKSNKQRYKTKSDTASAAATLCLNNPGSRTRVIQKPGKSNPGSSSETDSSVSATAGYVQVMSADNKPLCIYCHSEYETDLLSTSVVSEERHAWQTRFCSPQCADNFWMVSHSAYIRSSAKSLDSGVCEQCGVNGTELYERIKRSRSLKERAELLQSSKYASLSSHVKVTMVKDPSEGQFWHVDHILPVYAGGGQCEMDNLRTLCTPCHSIITSAQAGHRARMKASIGNQTITDFFSPGTKVKLKTND